MTALVASTYKISLDCSNKPIRFYQSSQHGIEGCFDRNRRALKQDCLINYLNFCKRCGIKESYKLRTVNNLISNEAVAVRCLTLLDLVYLQADFLRMQSFAFDHQ